MIKSLKFSFFEWVNIISFCAYSWTFIYGYAKNINIILTLGSLLIWFLSSIIIEPSWINRIRPLYKFILPLLFVDTIYVLAMDLGADYFITPILGILWIPIGTFYLKHSRISKFLLLFSAIVFTVDCIHTVIGNTLYPGISRLQAIDIGNQLDNVQLMQSLHIGGYPLLYGLSFLIFPLLLLSKFKVVSKYIMLPFIILCFYTVLMGSYFINLLLCLLFIIISLVDVRNLKRLSIYVVFFGLIFTLAKDPILDGIIYLGEQSNSTFVVAHAIELKEGEEKTSRTTGRIDLYKGAFNNFLDSPLLGQISNKQLRYESGHSEWLEYLEKYGLLSIPFFAFWISVFSFYKKNIRGFETKRYYNIFEIVFFAFLLVNPIRWSQPFVFVLFFAVPLLFSLLDNHIQLCYES